MYEEWEIRSLPREEKLEKAWRNLWGLRLEWDERVWERKQRAIERDIEWNEDPIARGGLNRTFSKARQMRCWGRCWENACQQLRYWESIQQQFIRSKNRSSIDPPGIKELSGLRYEKSLRSSTDSKVSRRYRGGVEPHFENSFPRGEKHKHECNPTCNLTNDPINTIISQNCLSI